MIDRVYNYYIEPFPFPCERIEITLLVTQRPLKDFVLVDPSWRGLFSTTLVAGEIVQAPFSSILRRFQG